MGSFPIDNNKLPRVDAIRIEIIYSEGEYLIQNGDHTQNPAYFQGTARDIAKEMILQYCANKIAWPFMIEHKPKIQCRLTQYAYVYNTEQNTLNQFIDEIKPHLESLKILIPFS